MLGTHWGAVHILDFEGNVIKSFSKHAATVNSISIDRYDEYVASASDDGLLISMPPIASLLSILSLY